MLPSREPQQGFGDMGCFCCFLCHQHFPLSPPVLSSTLATFGCLLLPGFSITSLSHFVASNMQGCHHTTHLKFPELYCFSLTKINNYSITSEHIVELKYMQYLQSLPLKIIFKRLLCVLFCYNFPLCTIFFGHFSLILHTCPRLLVYTLYIHKHVCICRLCRTLNNLKDSKTLNLPSIPA